MTTGMEYSWGVKYTQNRCNRKTPKLWTSKKIILACNCQAKFRMGLMVMPACITRRLLVEKHCTELQERVLCSLMLESFFWFFTVTLGKHSHHRCQTFNSMSKPKQGKNTDFMS